MTAPYYQDEHVTLYHGDCLDVLADLPADSVDAIVTDPPYGLEFMGKEWDAPWIKGTDVNADAGLSSTGYTDGSWRLDRPTFTGSTNPKCLTCKGTRRGRRDGTAVVPVCLCPDGGRFPNVRAVEMRAFGEWCESWVVECLRVLKPGGHLLAFGGSRTWHRLAVAVEDAGFEIRDSIAWLYGSGFPKSLDVSKAIDKAAGAEREVIGIDKRSQSRAATQGASNGGAQGGYNLKAECDVTAPATDAARQWAGWGTALKPAFEPIVVARKPLAGTVAGNVVTHGTGALNIDACRVEGEPWEFTSEVRGRPGGIMGAAGNLRPPSESHPAGRWPTNVVLDEVLAADLDRQTGVLTSGTMRAGTERQARTGGTIYGADQCNFVPADTYGDAGGASRFFPVFRYEPKAPASERPVVDGTAHPTVKPLDLMRWLVRLVTPPGGTVLEPFAGSGTTAEACVIEGFRCIAIERDPQYLPLIIGRLSKPIAGVLPMEGIG